MKTRTLGGPQASWRRWCLQAVLCCVFLAGALDDARAEPAALFWGVPAAARVMRWSGDEQEVFASARAVDPELPVHLDAGEWLVLPARPGARFRFTGGELLVGLGSGMGLLPDVITWLDLDASGELSVPSHSSAGFVVLGRKLPGTVAVRVALPERDALRWHRFDTELARWVAGERAEAPVAPVPELAPTVRWLGALAQAFAKSDAGARSAWLTQRWLGEALRHRPLIAPYFARANLSAQGGRSVSGHGGLGGTAVGTAVEEGPWTELAPGERVTLHAASADVVRLTLQTRSAERVHLRVFEGEQVVRELALAEAATGSAGSAGAVRTSTLRAVVPVSNPRITVLAVEGHVSIAARAFVQRTDLFDGLSGRRRSRRAQTAAALRGDEPPDLLAALVALDAERSEAALRRVQRFAGTTEGPRASALAAELLAARVPSVVDVQRFERLLEQGTRSRHAGAFLRRVLETWVQARHPAHVSWDPFAASVQRWRAASNAPPPPGARRPFEDDEGAANEALLELLWPEPAASDRSPARAWRAEAGQLASGSARAVRWTRLLWQRGAPWTRLPLQPETHALETWEEPTAPAPDVTTCPVRSSGGITRWRLLDGSTALRFEARPGHYARVLLAAPDAGKIAGMEGGAPGRASSFAPDPVVSIAGVPLTVHGQLGLVAAVAVAPGVHAVSVEGRGPVLARIPSLAEAPCRSLREPVEWAVTDPEARYRVEPGSTAVPLRVVFRPGTLRPGETDELTVRAGDGTLRASARAPATGVVEGVLRGHPGDAASELVVHSRMPRQVRVSARLRPRTVEAYGAASAPPARVYVPHDKLSREAQAERERALERLERASRLLASSAEDQRKGGASPSRHEGKALSRDVLSRERRDALRELGFWRLASLEERAASPDSLEEGAAPVDPHNVLVFGARPNAFPLGWTPTVPPLAGPEADVAFARLRSARSGGTPSGGPRSHVARSGEPRDDEAYAALRVSLDSDVPRVETLLLALEAAGREDFDVAAEAVEKLAEAAGSVAAFERAASLWAEAAATSGDRKATGRALLAAHRAVELGGAASVALSRLRGAVTWKAPEHAGARASVILEHTARVPSLGERVYRAFLEAPPEAALLLPERQLQMRLDRREPSELHAEGHCLGLEGDATCRLDVLLDGQSQRCTRVGAVEGEPSATEGSRSLGARWTCRLRSTGGSHRLEVRVASAEPAVAWVRFREGAEAAPLVGRSLSRWNLHDARTPLRIAVNGPTVVQVRARAAGDAGWHDDRGRPSAGTRLRLRIEAPSSRTADVPPARHGARELLLPWNSDEEVTIMGAAGAGAVGAEVEEFVVLPDAGRHVVVLEPEEAALLQVRVALARGTPRRRVEPEAREARVLPPAASGRPGGGSPSVGAAPVADLATPGAFTLRGYVAGFDTELTETDRDPRARYLEVGAGVQRSLVPDRLWVGANLFSRSRFGPDSQGLDLNVDVSSRGPWPGVFVRGHWVRQNLSEGVGTGGYASAGVLWSLPFGENVALVPSTGVTLRRADERGRGAAEVDPSVFTDYAADHPWTPSAGLRVDYRPFVDTILRLGTAARVNPGLSDLDRVDLRGTVHTLPGAGLWPWFTLDTIVSHRPADAERALPFVRVTVEPRVTFWAWLAGSHRLTLSAVATYLRDWPQSARSGSVGSALALGYDWTDGRGLSDLPPRERLFRDRLEEGSGFRRTPPPPGTSTWEAAP